MVEAADPAMIAALRAWRSSAARLSGVPAYVICHDTTLAAVASALPASHDELLALPGLGPVKAARYGEALLDLVSQHRRSA
jgi:superfamily II DNA helicase RecQ